MPLENRCAERTFWVVVADESQAKFYTRDTKRGPLAKMCSLENTASRKKGVDLLTDRGGRSFDSVGAGRHTMSAGKVDLKKQVSIAFAKQVAERIGKATHNGSCRGYALIAAPRFLGILRDAVSKKCKFEPFKTIDRDVVGYDTATFQKLVDND